MKIFKGRTAVVTGGASGIGRAMADRFAQEGVKIVLADIEQSALDRAVSEMQAAGAKVIGVKTDVSDYAQVEALAQRTLEAFGAVHIVCNNAGVSCEAAPSWEMTDQDWRWVINVNLWGVIHGIRAFVPIMIRQDDEGHVINTASLAGLVAMPTVAPYHATKFAVVATSESLYQEFLARKLKLRASVLCPAWVKTNILDSERNRPTDLRNENGKPGSTLKAQMRDLIQAEGLDPAFVADKVFEAVRDEQLYILTHPQFNDTVRRRMENILDQRNPKLPEWR
jgi:NAD(P)-dependent dehydrogenase (short-subunit alcohol dehydrogenase family)